MLFPALLLALAASPEAPPPPVNAPVADLDLFRYQGTWYEQARLPNFFERGCVGVTATYGPREGGLSVENRCRQGTLQGPEKVSRGKAWAPNPQVSGALKVMFFWPFQGDYWVLEVGPEYEYALVGSPDRKTAWILTRAPQIDDERFNTLAERMQARGYPAERLERIPQATP